jgi:hypothetical protein
LTYGKKEVNVETYTYTQLDCKYDALCLKDKKLVGALGTCNSWQWDYKTCIFSCAEGCVGKEALK